MATPPKIVAIVPAAASTNDICLSQTRASAGALTLNGAKAGTTLAFARQLEVTSSANIAARVFTIVGTDANGRSITDTVTGVNNNSVSTTKYFATVSSVSVDASFSPNNVTVGTTEALATKMYPLDHYDEIAAQVAVELTAGTATWSVQETFSELSGTTANEVWITPTAHSAKSATLTAPLDVHARACRLITTAVSSPTLSLNIYQSGC